jgi:predicted metal-dependent hydrolase
MRSPAEASEIHSVRYGNAAVPFSLQRSARHTLGITVRADGSVLVRAPLGAAMGDIEARVQKRAGWILAQQARAERYRPRTPPRTYQEGETHLHLGRQLRLTVGLALAERVRIDGDRLVLAMHRPNRLDERAALLRTWRLEQAKRVYPKRLHAMFAPFVSYRSDPPRLLIRDLTHRWGRKRSGWSGQERP